MPNWSDPWEFDDRENPGQKIMFVKCKDCNKSMPEKFKGNHKCRVDSPETPKDTNEFKPSTTDSPVESDVKLLISIAKQLSFDLGKDIKELVDGERAWVSTIFIQRKRM